MKTDETGFAEKIRSINFGGIKKGSTPRANDDADYKRKLEGELSDQVNDGKISTKTADASAAIAGLCEE